MPKSYDSHPFADIFHLHDGAPLWEMSDDIKTNGLRFPIILFQGKILDGRRRLLACHRAKIDPKFKEFNGTEEEALKYVVSINLHRRHLGTSERAMAAAAFLAEMGKIAERVKNSNVFDSSAQICAEQNEPQKASANGMNVSARSVTMANKVLADGTPELQDAIKSGTVTVSDAAAIVDQAPEVQNVLLAAVVTGEAKTLKEAAKHLNVAKAAEEDPDGVLIPEEAKEAFQTAEKIYKVAGAIETLARQLDNLAKLPGGEMLSMHSITQSLRSVKQTVLGSRATHVCPYCDGKDMECQACKGRFWTVRSIWASSPKIEKRRRSE